MNVIVSPPAREDAILTQDRLEREQSGYGLAFAEEFRRAIEQIGTMPRLFSPTEDGPDDIETREFYIARFLQRVIFSIDGESVTILAVVHARKRPGSWIGRLSEWN